MQPKDNAGSLELLRPLVTRGLVQRLKLGLMHPIGHKLRAVIQVMAVSLTRRDKGSPC